MLPQLSLSREINQHFLRYFLFSLSACIGLLFFLLGLSQREGLNSICKVVRQAALLHGNESYIEEIQRIVDVANALEHSSTRGKITWLPSSEVATNTGGSKLGSCVVELHQKLGKEVQFIEIMREDVSVGALLLSWFDSYGVLILWVVLLFALPMWLATKNGLKPLRDLVKHLRAIGVESLSPTKIKTQYEEIQPLVDQIDSLIDELRKKVGSDKAFLHEAAHELRTPIAVIAAQAHVLVKSVNESSGDETLKALNSAVERTNHLVEQLLILAQLDSRNEYGKTQVKLSDVCSNTMAMLAPLAIEREIEFSLEIDEDVSLDVDEFLIYVIIKNLVSNALQYSNRQSTVRVSVRRCTTDVAICVQDTGPGIPVDEQPRLFERFFRGAATRSTTQGSGLGLSIVKAAVDSLGGKISVESALSGTSFFVRLPMPDV